MNARYAVTTRTGLAPAAALDRLLDPAGHAAVVPLTTLHAGDRGRPLAPGDRFVMRTALGRLRMDDPMVVDRLRRERSGGAVRFVKTGRVLRGVVLARVGPAPGGTVVRWNAELGVVGVPRLLDPVVAVVAHLAYGAALRRLLSADDRSERQPGRQDR